MRTRPFPLSLPLSLRASIRDPAHSPATPHRRALALWRGDNGLTLALTVTRKFVAHTEFLMMLWPNPRLRIVWQRLRYALVEACLKAGVPPPPQELPPRPEARKVPAASAPASSSSSSSSSPSDGLCIPSNFGV